VKDILRDLRYNNFPAPNSVDCQRFVIRRKHVFEDALHRFSAGLDFSLNFKITFVGEPAADKGGPLREFLCLLMSSIAENNSLF